MIATRRALAVLLVVLAAACSRGRGDGVASLHLVDALDRAKIASAVDLAATDDAILRDAEVLLRGEWGALESERGRSIAAADAPWAWPLLSSATDRETAPAPAEARLQVIGADSSTLRPVRVRVRLEREVAAGEALWLAELPPPFAKESLADTAALGKLLRGGANFLHRLAPDAGDPRTYAAVVTPSMASATLLLCAAAREPLAKSRVEVERLSRRAGWILTSARPGRSPWAREIAVAAVTRDCIALAPPCSVSVAIEVPERQPLLQTACAVLWDDSGGSYEFELRATVDGEEPLSVRRSVQAGAAGWKPIELALDAFAGRTATIELSARPANGGADAGAVAAFGSAVVEGAAADELAAPPDVILISLDTVRADRLTPYGSARDTTPGLARLAQSSVVFDRAIAAAPWTLPSHVSMLSGQQPDRHGVNGTSSRIDDATPLLAEEFARAGYETVAVTGGGYVNPEFGFARGFERFGVGDPAYPPQRWAAARGDDLSRKEAQASARVRREMMELLESRRRRPLFLFVHTYAAHNYAASPEVLLEFGAKESEIGSLLAGLDTLSVARRMERPQVSPAEKDELIERARLLYDGSLREADQLVDEIVVRLGELRRLDHTIVVVTADHGEELLERGKVGHGHSLYEEMIRVPLIVRAPGIAPRRVAEVVSGVDVAATLRDLCGLRPIGDESSFAALQDGRSLRPLLLGEACEPMPALSRGSRRDVVFRSLRGARLKYVETAVPGAPPAAELLDLDRDPLERENVAPARPDDAARFGDSLARTVAALRERAAAGGSSELSPELQEQLRALGYLGGNR